MTDFPLLPLSTPEIDARPAGPRGFGKPIVPSRQRQGERLQPTFQRVQDVFDRGDDPLTLLADPAAIAPERALVFEVAGNVDALGRAVRNLPGLEYLGDEALEFEPGEDFAEVDNRRGREGQPRLDRPVGGRLYLTMPDTRALQELLRLWDRHQGHLAPGSGNQPWFDVFDQLHRLRAWGPEDRLPDDTVVYLNERLEDGRDSVRLEVELWWRGARRARSRFAAAVEAAHGQVVHQASIPEIGYQAALVDVPVAEARRLAAREEVALAICDDIMLIRPQSTAAFPTDANETDAGRTVELRDIPEGPPIVAVFDGVPVLAHQLLDRRIEFDDPDDLADQSVVSERLHGTEMASLVIHGDRNLQETPLTRPIYVRPVLYAPGNGSDEVTQPNRLLVDTIYRAVLRMREGDGDAPPQAPDVFIVNLSLGDPQRPFAGPMSPWARLLDYLADRFSLLFIVSAGNIKAHLPVPAFQGTTDFEAADAIDRQQAILEALGKQRSQRTLLSPAEALNPVTVGAWHEDTLAAQPSAMIYRPYVDVEGGPNITSAMGLGHNRVVKPDIFMPGGKEHLLPVRSGGGLVVRAAESGRIHGLKAAMPDEVGRLDREGLTAGTSAATALATRSAHRLFDALMDEENGGVLQDADRRYYGVVIKALLVHRARWGEVGTQLEDVYGPTGRGTHIARRDNIARVLGYGRPNVEEALTCAANRATLVGYGEVAADGTASLFRVPLPRSLERVTEPRTITLTLAWFSPVNIRHRLYRKAKLEIAPNDFKTSAGVERSPAQPSDKSVPRGSLFHVRYEGHRAVPFVDDGHLSFRVFCRAQGGPLDERIRFGIAVTIEAGENVPVYQEIRQRLGVRARGTS